MPPRMKGIGNEAPNAIAAVQIIISKLVKGSLSIPLVL